METATKLDFYKKIVHDPNGDYVKTFHDAIRSAKIVQYTGLPEMTDDEYYDFYIDLVDKGGEVVDRDENTYTGDQTNKRWLDIRYDPKHPTTFRHSNTQQPLHTDSAYTTYDIDLSLFYCLANPEIGGATTFYDLPDLKDHLGKYDPQLLKDLQEKDVIFDKGGDESRITKILFSDEKGDAIQWNWFRVSDKNPDDVKEMCNKFHDFLQDRVVAGGLVTPVKLARGEAAFFHDIRLLHGRNAFLGYRCLIKGGLNL